MTTGVVVELDLSVYRLDAIKKAAYRFGGRCFTSIELPEASTARVTLTPRGGPELLEQLAGEFRNEVLDQELREVVAKETEAIRNLIVVQAFSKTSLLDAEGESGSVEVDPLDIRRPDAR